MADQKKTRNSDNKVLILCQDNKLCYQLQKYLTYGPHYYLFLTALENGVKFTSIAKKFEKCENLKQKFTQSEKLPVKQNRIRKTRTNDKTKLDNEENNEMENPKDLYVLSMTQSNNDGNNELQDYTFEPCSEIENADLTQLTEACDLTILIQSFKSRNYFLLQKTLEDVQPNYIIVYNCNITAIRQIELYEARRQKDRPLKIYFLIHAGTVEEQNYLTTLRREKEAFEFLIETRSKMAVSEEQDGKIEECVTLERNLVSKTASTRQGGKLANNTSKQFVIVDMREFRSELPALIHKRGIDIEPVTITVGDYILTPDICVERKSLSDLVGSLNSGRLYQQCTQMCRYYSKPMLLIEFDQNRPFSWQSNYMVSSDGNSFDVQQKLLLLTLHFPKLKIIWSSSPYSSAQLFEELKYNNEEPNLQYATAIASEEDLDVIQAKYNPNIYDFLQKLPGISSKNINTFLRKVGNFHNAISKSKDELKEILGSSGDASLFYSILHDDHIPKDNNESNEERRKFTKKLGPKKA